jgi:V/A-type H+-transporting ATPase subunit I
MPWRDAMLPVRMQRIALVTPKDALRDALVRVADAGVVDLDRATTAEGGTEGGAGEAARRLARVQTGSAPPRLARCSPDLDLLEREERADLLAGEVELEDRASAAVVRDGVAALAGWTPAAELVAVARRLAEVGAAAVPLPRPSAVDPPTLLRTSGPSRPFAPLVETYGTVRYADVDPSLLAGVAYVVMFGMMFADAGHGAVLLLGALLVRAGRPRRFRWLRPGWPFLAGAGLASAVFGLLYGEFFGPTGVVPVIWLAPLDEPVTLLLAAIGVGAVLLAGAYALGTVNRWREGGWRYALYASSGLAGAGLFLGLGLVVAAWYGGWTWLALVGGLIAAVAVVLTFLGLFAEAGGGASGATQASIELFDTVVRLGSNLVSFARLAAFGLTHAALGLVVWTGTTALWGRGGVAVIGAVLLFVLGNAVNFSLEALVAAVQALRLEYYELFSRIFQNEGRPFRPWHIPVLAEEAS